MFISFCRSLAAGLVFVLAVMPAHSQSMLTATFGFSGAKGFARAIIAEDADDGFSTAIERYCLVTGIYHEARGEPEIGQVAVGETILNRVRASVYPDTICGVVFENSHMKNSCQFSFACDERSDAMKDNAAITQIARVAGKLIDGFKDRDGYGRSEFFNKRTPFMTHYHRYDVHPNWSNDLEILAHIGNHVFFRSDRVVNTYQVDDLITASTNSVPAINASNPEGL